MSRFSYCRKATIAQLNIESATLHFTCALESVSQIQIEFQRGAPSIHGEHPEEIASTRLYGKEIKVL